MSNITTVDDNKVSIIVTQEGSQGKPGRDGTDGVGLNLIRKSLVENPLCHCFAPNFLARRGVGVLGWIRNSTATYTDRYGQFREAEVDEPRQTSHGWTIEQASQNLLLNSAIPATQDVTLMAGEYTLSVIGSGQAQTSYGTATEGSPLTFTSAGETLTVTVVGSLTRFWLEPLPYQTTYTPSQSTAGSRGSDTVYIYNQNNVVLDSSGFSVFANVSAGGCAAGSVIVAVDTDPADGFILSINGDRTVTATLKDAGGTVYTATSTTALGVFVLTSVAVSFDSGELTIYVNGVAEATTAIIGELCSVPFNGATWFGTGGFNGNIQGLRFYGEALNATEIDYLSRG